MEERQQQIRERAGLEESRLNQDFIEFLSKWGTPVLFVLALCAAGFWGYQKLQARERTTVDTAFLQLSASADSPEPNPESLIRVAEEHGKVGAIGVLARMDAADAYMRIVRRGVKPGAAVKEDGTVENPDSILPESERAAALTQAGDLYKAAYEQAATTPSRMPLTIGSLFGLAAVAECRQDFDGAKAQYQEIIRLTEGSTFAAHGAIAKGRIEQLSVLKDLPRVYARAELPSVKAETDTAPPFNLPPGVTVTPLPGPPAIAGPQPMVIPPPVPVPAPTPDAATPPPPVPPK